MLNNKKVTKKGLTEGVVFAIIHNVVARTAQTAEENDNKTILENDTARASNKV